MSFFAMELVPIAYNHRRREVYGVRACISWFRVRGSGISIRLKRFNEDHQAKN